jgi:iron(II)-dependent oxidoreductase
MIGNVLEWTADRYKPYPVSHDDSPDFAENFIVLRGGSWIHEGANIACFTRLYAPPDNRDNFIGFRCARDIQ